MYRSYQYILYPTPLQEDRLLFLLNSCCELYNTAKEQRIIGYKQFGKSVNYYDQQQDLTELRKDPRWGDISVEILRSAIQRVDHAYQKFFNGKARYPKWKSTNRYKSFSFGGNPIIIKNGKIKIPNLGRIKLTLSRAIPAGAKLKFAHIKRHPTGRWTVSFDLDMGPMPAKVTPDLNKVVGIDLGISTLAQCSDGYAIENPRYYKNLETKISTIKKERARKQQESNNKFRTVIRLAKAYERLKNLRLDYLRKKAKEIVLKYDVIILERLSVANLCRGFLSKSIYDSAWTLLVKCITTKAEEYGKYIIFVDPKNTSQLCSGCNRLVPKGPGEAHSCPYCGLVMDRDLNASINIKSRGLRVLETLEGSRLCGEDYSVAEREASD